MIARLKKYIIETPSGKKIEGQILKGYVALFIDSDFWILSKGYTLYKFNPRTHEISYFSRLVDSKSSLAARFRVTRRLLRAEITHLYKFKDDNWFCIARKAIFRYNPQNGLFEKCHRIERGSRPMNLCQGEDGTIYYGEYFFNPKRVPVSIKCSKDNGNSWTDAYTFANGEINHIHGIFNDKYTGQMWVFTGDDDCACIAGYTTDGFKTLHREFEGNQKYRVCVPIFKDGSIVYPTDSQYAQNAIRVINRKNKTIRDVASIQGSGIYVVDAGNVYAVSTTVEPSEVNTDRSSHLWVSKDGEHWEEIVSFPKDSLKTTYFQFGSLRFPHYQTVSDYLVVTGRAVRTLDQSTLIIPIEVL